MRKRFVIATVLAAALMLGSISTAFADDSSLMQKTPAVLQQVGFESVNDSLVVYDYNLNDFVLALAKWAPVTGGPTRVHSGSYALWCAGTSPASFPHYPSPTRGQAVFPVTDTSGFYQSQIQFCYIEPNWGAAEGSINPFKLNWVDASSSPTASTPGSGYVENFLPAASTWTTVTVSRGPGTGRPSDGAGYFRFNFFTNSGDLATQQGATIDDVKSTAYLFGPTGIPTATRGASPHTAVTVSWTPSFQTTQTPHYSVWRHDVAANTWTLVNAVRTTALSVVDTGTSVNKVYDYAVQPFEGVTGFTNWGPLTSSAQVGLASATSISATFSGSQTATTVVSGTKVRITGTLRDIDGTAISGQAGSIVIQATPHGGSSWATSGTAITETGVTGSYVGTVTVASNADYRLRFAGAGGYSESLSTPVLQATVDTSTPPPTPKPVDRLSGANRYLTAISIGQQAFPGWVGVRHVIIASGDNGHLPDALTAAGLAGVYNAPVLLSPTAYLDADLKAAIQAMPAGVQVHVVGGTPSVSAAVYTKIKALSKVAGIERIYGSDRYATAAAVARKMQSVMGVANMPKTVLFTSGGDLLDPLIASTVSFKLHYPVLLVARTSVPAPTTSVLAALSPNERYIVGSVNSVSDTVRDRLFVAPGNRISGADINGDAVAFAERAKSLNWLGNANVGFAAAVPDAATGGALMGKRNGPMLLVGQSAVPQVTQDYLNAHNAEFSAGYIFGGAPTISDSVRASLLSFIN
jgi:putative cell wall-binding protein